MPAGGHRLFVFARHAESSANAADVLSTDPSQPVALTAQGRAQARALGAQLANLHVDLAVGTRLLRTQQSIDLALDGRQVPTVIEPGFDEIRAGDLEGARIDAYWSWRVQHTAADPLPHGESIDDALRRYAGALRRLLARKEKVTLVVIHEIAFALYRRGRRDRPLASQRHGLPERGTLSFRRARRPARRGQPGCVDIDLQACRDG
jgi:broad specificity phosphatase PhoE